MGRCKSLGSLKLFLRHASELSRANILFFSILNSPQAAPSGAAAVADSLTVGQHSVFTEMAGNIFCPHAYVYILFVVKAIITNY